jgi:hypothetical protein
MQVPVGRDLMQWVLGWSDSVVAMKPKKLREMLASVAGQLKREYVRKAKG